MSCGQIALQRAGFKNFTYYASEINASAIAVTMANYPNTIQLGDITAIKAADLPHIDLLIGGSPCQGFSMAGTHLNFEHSESKLFFEYCRLVDECKPDFFLLENVCMKKEWAEIITSRLGVSPIKIDSARLSAGHRKRLYWTNLPVTGLPPEKKIFLRDIWDTTATRENIYGRMKLKKPGTLAYRNTWGHVKTLDEKANCITARTPSITNTSSTNVKLDDVTYAKLSIVEYERLQTVPDGYTKSARMSERFRMLGNGWTVDIIAWIFSHIEWIDEKEITNAIS